MYRCTAAAAVASTAPGTRSPGAVNTPSVDDSRRPVTKPVAGKADSQGSQLIVGPNIKLKGVEITDCDTLVVEGHVEATMDSRMIQNRGERYVLRDRRHRHRRNPRRIFGRAHGPEMPDHPRDGPGHRQNPLRQAGDRGRRRDQRRHQETRRGREVTAHPARVFGRPHRHAIGFRCRKSRPPCEPRGGLAV